MIESSKAVKPWREAVVWACRVAAPVDPDPIWFRGPVSMTVTFSLIRPKSAKRGAVPDKKPDIDKLLRSTFDALKTAGVYEDDSRVVHVEAYKVYAGDPMGLGVPGAVIEMTAL